MINKTRHIPKEARDFQWRVPFGGFRWTPKETSASGRHLIPAGEWVEWRSTWPLKDEPALFRLLAELAPEEDSIRRFADEHGQLRSNEELRPAESTIVDWAVRISGMRMAIQLHDGVRARDAKEFDGLIKIENGAAVVEPRLIGHLPGLGDFWELPKQPAELDEPRLLLWRAKTVVKRIAEHCIFWSGLRPRFDDDPAASNLSLSRVPTTLLGALWLQFAFWVQGGRSFPECKQCGKRFAAALDKRRAGTDFCSDACRARQIPRSIFTRAGGFD